MKTIQEHLNDLGPAAAEALAEDVCTDGPHRIEPLIQSANLSSDFAAVWSHLCLVRALAREAKGLR